MCRLTVTCPICRSHLDEEEEMMCQNTMVDGLGYVSSTWMCRTCGARVTLTAAQ